MNWYKYHKEHGDRCKNCQFFEPNEFFENFDWCKYHEEHIFDKNEVCEDYK